jgi:hypothetical protein
LIFCIQSSELNIPGKRERFPDYLGNLSGRWIWRFESRQKVAIFKDQIKCSNETFDYLALQIRVFIGKPRNF